ncbi:MAG: hypothetical protein IK007_05730 [Lachnospiraceae bacterium]|nr:hypothetical protein [Lachnospiraceae bacterium]
MPGRIFAGILAVLLMTLVPLKMRGVKEAERTENAVREVLNSAYEDIRCTGVVDTELWERMNKRLGSLGFPYELDITIGTVFVGRSEKAIRCSYNNSMSESLETTGAVDVRGKLVTVTVTPLKECFAYKLSNILWDSYIYPGPYVTGGYIN